MSAERRYLLEDKETGEVFEGCYLDHMRDGYVFVAPMDYTVDPPGQDRPHRFIGREEVRSGRFVVHS